MEKNCSARGVYILFWKKKCFDFEIGFEGDQREFLLERKRKVFHVQGLKTEKAQKPLRGSLDEVSGG